MVSDDTCWWGFLKFLHVNGKLKKKQLSLLNQERLLTDSAATPSSLFSLVLLGNSDGACMASMPCVKQGCWSAWWHWAVDLHKRRLCQAHS